MFTGRRYNLHRRGRSDHDSMLITDPEGEQFWRSITAIVRELPGNKRLVPFTADEGRSRHCEPMARSRLEQRMFDWLDETLAAATT